MTENTENLVLEILRQMRSDLTDLRNETRDGFARIEVALTAIHAAIVKLL